MFDMDLSLIMSERLSDSNEYRRSCVSGDIEDECTEIGSEHMLEDRSMCIDELIGGECTSRNWFMVWLFFPGENGCADEF